MRLMIAGAVVLVWAAIPTRAEIVPKSPEQLQKMATHVVQGRVKAIYTHGAGWPRAHD